MSGLWVALKCTNETVEGTSTVDVDPSRYGRYARPEVAVPPTGLNTNPRPMVVREADEMLVTPHLYATPGRSAPMLHLRRLGPSGVFSRFSAHFEGIWSDSRPIDTDRPAWPIRSGT